MFTKNYYGMIMGALFYGGVSLTGKTYYGVNGTLSYGNSSLQQLTNDSTWHASVNRMVTTVLPTSVASSSASSKWASCTGVILGDGNTSPTIEDYSLSGNQITGFTYSNVITKESIGDGLGRLTCVYTITNNNDEAITISEIGLVTLAYVNSAYYPWLYERTVLDSPVTIEAGGVGQVQYIIEMKLPS